MQRRQFLIATSLTLSAMPSLAQGKPVRLIVPFPPGGATDITARAVAEQLSIELGQAVTVENKPGAGGSVGMAEVAKSPPDGLTLGVATVSTHGVNPAVYQNLPYDADKSFVAIAELVKAPGVLVVSDKLGVKDYAAFLALLQANPAKYSYASPGNGSIGHLWGEVFKSRTKTFMLHMPYAGAVPALNSVIGGQQNAYFDQVASSLSHIKAGRVRALAVSWSERLSFLPEVPTFREVGNESNNLPSWFGLVAPAGTPSDVVTRLHAAVVAALKATAVRERLGALGLYPSVLTSPQQFSVQIRKEIWHMQQAARFAKIQLD